MASNFGGLIQGVGAAWLMTTIAGSADMVALVQTSTTLPVMIFSVVAGAVADSFPRRHVMLIAQTSMFAISVALAVTAWLGLLTPWTLLAFTFLIGCGVAFNNPAWQAAVGDVVPRDKIASAVLLNSVSFNATRSVGPALGGAVVVAAGAPATFALNALSYLGLIGVLLRWRPDLPVSTLPREELSSAMIAGIRYVAMSPKIGKVMLRGFVFGLTTIVILALLPLVARELLAGDALVYGILLGGFGIGAVCGAFISRHARDRLSNEVLVRWTFLALAASAAIIAQSRSAWLTGSVLIVCGAAWVMSLSLLNTTVQMSTPRWVVARALSLYQMAIFGGMALGSWGWGALAERFSVELALLAAGGAMLSGAAIGLKLPLPAQDALNLNPLNRWQEPQIGMDVQPRSGPVLVSVEYQIPEAAVPEFLDVMVDRHRIRRRDGAHHWALMRDLEHPTRWVETFEIPTWVDYVRLHARTTHADAHVGDRIRALNAGNEGPTVRRMIIREPSRSPAVSEHREATDLQP